LVSLAHKVAVNVIRANRIIIIDTPAVPPMAPASAVAMIGENPPPSAAEI